MPNVEPSPRSRAAVASVKGAERQYLVVYVGDERYATPLEQVREVVDAKQCLPVPNALPYVKGIVDLRGQILSVMDLSYLLRESFGRTPSRVTLVVETDAGLIGLNVEDVYGVVSLGAHDILSETSHPGEGQPTALGVAKLEGHLVTLIDVSDLVTRTPVLHA